MLAKSLRRTAGFSEQNERKTAFENVAVHRFIELTCGVNWQIKRQFNGHKNSQCAYLIIACTVCPELLKIGQLKIPHVRILFQSYKKTHL